MTVCRSWRLILLFAFSVINCQDNLSDCQCIWGTNQNQESKHTQSDQSETKCPIFAKLMRETQQLCLQLTLIKHYSFPWWHSSNFNGLPMRLCKHSIVLLNTAGIERFQLSHAHQQIYEKSFLNQTWILAPDIGQCPAKNRVMSDIGCFTTEKVVRREVKTIF